MGAALASRKPAASWVDAALLAACALAFCAAAGDAAFMRQPIYGHWLDNQQTTLGLARNMSFDALIAFSIARYWIAIRARSNRRATALIALAFAGYTVGVVILGEPTSEYRHVVTTPRTIDLMAVALWCGWRTYQIAGGRRLAKSHLQDLKASVAVGVAGLLWFVATLLISGDDLNWKLGALAIGFAKLIGAAVALSLYRAGISAGSRSKAATYITLAAIAAMITLCA